MGLLALVAGQDVEPAGDSDGTDGRWRIARKVSEDPVISVHDPETRHTRKSPEARRDGYRAHVVADPQTGIITGERPTKACGEDNSDAADAGQFLAGEATSGGPEYEWYGDSAYGTGDLRAAISQAGHTAVIKPGPLRPAVDGGFTTGDFTVDEAAGTVTCPAGVTRPVTARRAVIFGAACRSRPGCAAGAPLPRMGGPCTCTPTMRSCGPPAQPGRLSPPWARTTRNTGPTSNG